MALATELSVYKSTYDLTLKTFNIVKSFSREYKYTLGETMKTELLKISVLVYRANVSRENRTTILAEAREYIEALRLLFRLAYDLKTVPLKKFVDFTESIEAISKQLVAWQKTSEKYS